MGSEGALLQPLQLLLAQVSLHLFDTVDTGYAALSSDGGVSSAFFLFSCFALYFVC